MSPHTRARKLANQRPQHPAMNESGLLTPQHPGDEAKDRANTTTPAEETKVCMLTAENLGKSPSYMTEGTEGVV